MSFLGDHFGVLGGMLGSFFGETWSVTRLKKRCSTILEVLDHLRHSACTRSSVMLGCNVDQVA